MSEQNLGYEPDSIAYWHGLSLRKLKHDYVEISRVKREFIPTVPSEQCVMILIKSNLSLYSL